MELTKNVYFVGFMGAGKSTIARKLARSEGLASLDIDRYIERCRDKTIPQIFEEGGEGLFREIELQTLQELSERDYHMLIACGGGIIETEACRELLKRPENVVIHLDIDSDASAARIGNKEKRPLFKDKDQARELSLKRLPLYREVADLTIDTKGKSTWEISREVTRFLRDKGVLCPSPE